MCVCMCVCVCVCVCERVYAFVSAFKINKYIYNKK